MQAEYDQPRGWGGSSECLGSHFESPNRPGLTPPRAWVQIRPPPQNGSFRTSGDMVLGRMPRHFWPWARASLPPPGLRPNLNIQSSLGGGAARNGGTRELRMRSSVGSRVRNTIRTAVRMEGAAVCAMMEDPACGTPGPPLACF